MAVFICSLSAWGQTSVATIGRAVTQCNDFAFAKNLLTGDGLAYDETKSNKNYAKFYNPKAPDREASIFSSHHWKSIVQDNLVTRHLYLPAIRQFDNETGAKVLNHSALTVSLVGKDKRTEAADNVWCVLAEIVITHSLDSILLPFRRATTFGNGVKQLCCLKRSYGSRARFWQPHTTCKVEILR